MMFWNKKKAKSEPERSEISAKGQGYKEKMLGKVEDRSERFERQQQQQE